MGVQGMSSAGTPTQHNSTLAISPFVTGRSSTRTNASHSQRQQAPGQHRQFEGNDQHGGQDWNTEGMARSPVFQGIANSPLVQKTNPNITTNSLATPHHRNAGNNGSSLLASISKSGLFGSTMPSTLRKVSLQREYRNPTVNIDKESSGVEQPTTTTTLMTTTTSATNGSGEFKDCDYGDTTP